MEFLFGLLLIPAWSTAFTRSKAAQEVTLQVEDNGVGFEAAAPEASNRSTWGLLGMQERAELLGGTFEIRSSLGAGTRVQVTIPYQQALKEQA